MPKFNCTSEITTKKVKKLGYKNEIKFVRAQKKNTPITDITDYATLPETFIN